MTENEEESPWPADWTEAQKRAMDQFVSDLSALYVRATSEPDSPDAGTARLSLFRSGGWAQVFPSVFSAGLHQSLITVEAARQAGNDKNLEHALQSAVAVCGEFNDPLKVGLLTDLAKCLMQLSGAQPTYDAYREAFKCAEAASILADGCILPLDDKIELFQTLSDLYLNNGDGDRIENLRLARTHVRSALSAAEGEGPMPSVRKAMARNNIAAVLMQEGTEVALREAKDLLTSAAGDYKSLLGKHHSLTQSTVGNLIGTRRALRKYVYQESTEGLIDLGEDYLDAPSGGTLDPVVMPLIANLSACYSERVTGDRAVNFDRAIELAELAVELAVQRSGPYSFNHALALSQLASVSHRSVEGRHSHRMQGAAQTAAQSAIIAMHLWHDTAPFMLCDIVNVAANILADNAESVQELTSAVSMHDNVVTMIGIDLETSASTNSAEYFINLSLSLTRLAVFGSERSWIVDEAAAIRATEICQQIFATIKDDRDLRRTDMFRTVASQLIILNLTPHEVSGKASSVQLALEILTQFLPEICSAEDATSAMQHAKIIGTLLGHHAEWEHAARVLSTGAKRCMTIWEDAVGIESRTRAVVDAGSIFIDAAYSLGMIDKWSDAYDILEDSKARWLKATFDTRAIRDRLQRQSPQLFERFDEIVEQLSILETEELSSPNALSRVRVIEAVETSDRHRHALLSSLRAEFREIGRVANLAEADGSEMTLACEPDYPIVQVAVSGWGALSIIRWPGSETFTGKHFPTFTHDDLVRFVQGDDQNVGFLSGQIGTRDEIKHSLNALSELGRELADDIADAAIAEGFNQIIVVPFAGMGTIPFHLMGTVPIASRLIVSYTPSEIMLRTKADRISLTSGHDDTYAGGCDSTLGFAALEVAIARSYFAKTVELNECKAPSQLLLELHSSRIIHLACHGFYHRDDPGQAHVKLNNGERLYLRQLLVGLHLPQCDLAVIAACDSAVSARLPDEAINFVSSFLFAGAQSVVGSMWKVGDLPSFLLMSDFLRRVSENSSTKAEALSRSQEWLRTLTVRGLAELSALFASDANLVLSDSNRARLQAIIEATQTLPEDELLFENPVDWAGYVLSGNV